MYFCDCGHQTVFKVANKEKEIFIFNAHGSVIAKVAVGSQEETEVMEAG